MQSVLELEDADARIRLRRRVLERTRDRLATARSDEARKQAAVVEARTNARRFEIWVERTEAAKKAGSDRAARLAEDELAARTWRPA
jgi:hypothetical protein